MRRAQLPPWVGQIYYIFRRKANPPFPVLTFAGIRTDRRKINHCCPLKVMTMELPSPGVAAGKTKTGINPLRRMQNVSCEPWTLYPSENPSSKLGYSQTATSSPYRVLHPAQGDKQKKQASSSTTRNTSSATRHLVLCDKNLHLHDKNDSVNSSVFVRGHSKNPFWSVPSVVFLHHVCFYRKMVYSCLSPCRGWMPSVRRCWQAFSLGVKSLLL